MLHFCRLYFAVGNSVSAFWLCVIFVDCRPIFSQKLRACRLWHGACAYQSWSPQTYFSAYAGLIQRHVMKYRYVDYDGRGFHVDRDLNWTETRI